MEIIGFFSNDEFFFSYSFCYNFSDLMQKSKVFFTFFVSEKKLFIEKTYMKNCSNESFEKVFDFFKPFCSEMIFVEEKWQV